jgi:hypothetical protein
MDKFVNQLFSIADTVKYHVMEKQLATPEKSVGKMFVFDKKRKNQQMQQQWKKYQADLQEEFEIFDETKNDINSCCNELKECSVAIYKSNTEQETISELEQLLKISDLLRQQIQIIQNGTADMLATINSSETQYDKNFLAAAKYKQQRQEISKNVLMLYRLLLCRINLIDP